MASEPTYSIIRMFQDEDQPRMVIKKGLTLEQVKAHCSDPETSSSTCTNSIGLDRTERLGRWFDGYEKDLAK